MLLNATEAINGGLYEKQKSITVNFAPVCRYNALFYWNDSKRASGTPTRYKTL